MERKGKWRNGRKGGNGGREVSREGGNRKEKEEGGEEEERKRGRKQGRK